MPVAHPTPAIRAPALAGAVGRDAASLAVRLEKAVGGDGVVRSWRGDEAVFTVTGPEGPDGASVVVAPGPAVACGIGEGVREGMAHLATAAPSPRAAATPPPQAGGRYALAAYDSVSRRVVLARDTFGQEPLYFALRGGTLVFASDTRVLRAVLGSFAPSAKTVVDYLVFNHPLQPRSFYAGIESVPPGAVLAWDVDGGVRAVHADPRAWNTAGAASTAAFREALGAALSAALPPGTPSGLHLSGGVDSSLLCHLAARGGMRPRTWTAFYTPRHPDLRYARTVARETGADSREIHIAPEAVVPVLEELVGLLDSPLMATGVPTFWFTARAARASGDRLLVSGIGADHPTFGAARLSRTPGGGLWEACANVEPRTVEQVVQPRAVGLRRALGRLRDEFAASLAEGVRDEEKVERFFAGSFLPEHLRMAAGTHRAHGVEIRSPFLDQAVMREGLRLSRAAQDGGSSKPHLRGLLREMGSAAADRPGKSQMSLSLPRVRELLRADMVREFAERRRRIPGLDYDALQRTAATRAPASRSRLRLLWVVYNLHLWLRVTGAEAPDPSSF